MAKINKPHAEISGILPVLSTPFTEGNKVDYDALHKEVDHVIETGVDGVVFALVSELPSLTEAERLKITEELPKMADGRVPVVISVGAQTAQDAIGYAKAAQKHGAAAVMAIPPSGIQLTKEGLVGYFGGIQKVFDGPVIVQDASSYFGEPISVDLQAHLKDVLKEVYFKPECNPVPETISALQEKLSGGVVFEGSGGLYLINAYRRGISGCIPGSDLVHAIVPIWQALEDGKWERARELHYPVMGIVTLQEAGGLETYVAIEKFILSGQGVLPNALYRKDNELVKLTDGITMSEVDRYLGDIGRML